MPIKTYKRKIKSLENVTKSCYNNLIMYEQKSFIAEYTPEAIKQFRELDEEYQDKILSAIKTFEYIGTKYKNLNDLGNGLFEIKPKDVRAYFQYDKTRRKIIIIGFITLKKTQKAPKRYIEQALRNIENYKRSFYND